MPKRPKETEFFEVVGKVPEWMKRFFMAQSRGEPREVAGAKAGGKLEILLMRDPFERGGAIAFDPADKLAAMFPEYAAKRGDVPEEIGRGTDPTDPDDATALLTRMVSDSPEHLAETARIRGRKIYCVEDEGQYWINSEFGVLGKWPVGGDMPGEPDADAQRLRMLRLFDRIYTKEEYDARFYRPKRREPDETDSGDSGNDPDVGSGG